MAGTAAVVRLGSAATGLASQVGSETFGRPLCREQESKANEISIGRTARAGDDPWRKMAAATAAGTPQYLSAHPLSATRIQDLEARLAAVVPRYDAARH